MQLRNGLGVACTQRVLLRCVVEQPADNLCALCDLESIIKGNALVGWEGIALLLKHFRPNQVGEVVHQFLGMLLQAMGSDLCYSLTHQT